MNSRLLPILAVFGWLSVLTAAEQPNILWITSEDNGPWLGCFGDPVARSPNLDRLAEEGMRFTHCFSNAAVCAPARQTLITGMYATSLGGQHMRSKVTFPEGVALFPKYLRKAGYYASNNRKTDYNGEPANGIRAAMAEAWDESSSTAHWRNRKDGQPFFSVFNLTDSHESRLFEKAWKKRELKTDPATVKLPDYLPDLPEIRRDLARYYDCIEVMDRKVGGILAQLEADGLAEDTIVFYFADHGGSLPRGKSFTYDSGTRVPLIVRIPEKWRHLSSSDLEWQSGGSTDRLVSFVDFAATVLSLAGMEAPEYMQGKAFLGAHATEPREFVHIFRGRRGERYDIVRGVRSKGFLYLRNFSPQVPVMQFNGYSWNTIPSYRAWWEAWKAGDLPAGQARWFEAPKPPVEFYTVVADPDCSHNLASDEFFLEASGFLEAMEKHAVQLASHFSGVRDSGLFPEGLTGREWAAYQDDERYPVDALFSLALRVSSQDPEFLEAFREALDSANPCARYWGVMGCVVLGKAAKPAEDDLILRLEDAEPLIRVQSARALAGMGNAKAAVPVLREFLAGKDDILKLRALLAIDECDLLAVAADELLPLVEKAGKGGSYGSRVAQHLIARHSE